MRSLKTSFKSSGLKSLRTILASLYLILFLIIYSDISGIITPSLIRSVTWPQFIPSFLKFLMVPALVCCGFIFVLLITLLFGRVYCSVLCPLGIIQDIFIRISRNFRIRKYRYTHPLKILALGILFICILPLFFRNIFFINLLDPYSLAGKIWNGFYGEVSYMWGNLLESGVKIFIFPVFSSLKAPGIQYLPLLISMVLLCVFVLQSIYGNRWFCNRLCPVGTVLGLCSRFSLFRIKSDPAKCTVCGTCESLCKANCIDHRKHRLDFDRCVVCFNCIISCRDGAMKYGLFRGRKDSGQVSGQLSGQVSGRVPGPRKYTDNSRRGFFRILFYASGTAAAVFTIRTLKFFAANNDESGACGESLPVMPPGAISIRHFTEKCTACLLCVSNCPTHVLQPAVFSYGLSGLFQPRQDFSVAFCKSECTVCTEVCPSGALQRLSLKEKKQLQTGLAFFVKNQCKVASERKPCALCYEACPTRAIELVSYLGDMKIPQVREQLCTGCGACENVCPVRPERAIYVEGYQVQRRSRELKVGS